MNFTMGYCVGFACAASTSYVFGAAPLWAVVVNMALVGICIVFLR